MTDDPEVGPPADTSTAAIDDLIRSQHGVRSQAGV